MRNAITQSGNNDGAVQNRKTLWLSIAGVVIIGIILANIHLVVVAVGSQPDCVPHDKIADDTTSHLRAAKSGC